MLLGSAGVPDAGLRCREIPQGTPSGYQDSLCTLSLACCVCGGNNCACKRGETPSTQWSCLRWQDLRLEAAPAEWLWVWRLCARAVLPAPEPIPVDSGRRAHRGGVRAGVHCGSADASLCTPTPRMRPSLCRTPSVGHCPCPSRCAASLEPRPRPHPISHSKPSPCPCPSSASKPFPCSSSAYKLFSCPCPSSASEPFPRDSAPCVQVPRSRARGPGRAHARLREALSDRGARAAEGAGVRGAEGGGRGDQPDAQGEGTPLSRRTAEYWSIGGMPQGVVSSS